MRKSIAMVAALLLLAGCAEKSAEEKMTKPESKGMRNADLLLKGDSTVYGLACEGCTDSVVVLLPGDDSDPITFNIIEAHRNHKVHGKLKVGDWVGLVRNPEDSTVADLVVNLDELKGTWCYVVMPKWRNPEAARMMTQGKDKAKGDSLRDEFFIPREYGFSLKRQWTAQSVGYVRQASGLEDESPVVYPRLLYFTEWHMLNGKLVMTSGEMKKQADGNMKVENNRQDTCDILFLGKDSLVLGSEGEFRSYYRRTGEDEINKLARQKAEERLRKAIEETR
ncbi:MAG: hypothetical protein K6C10_10325 [Prevotella sp.]|nr:hypothetical protein [Prevotella sp.]